MGAIAFFAFLAWETCGQMESWTERELSTSSEEREVFTSAYACFIELLVGEGGYLTVHPLLLLSPVRLRILNLDYAYFWIFFEREQFLEEMVLLYIGIAWYTIPTILVVPQALILKHSLIVADAIMLAC